MFDINTIPVSERVHITKNLLRYGIATDQETGKIEVDADEVKNIKKFNKLWLI